MNRVLGWLADDRADRPSSKPGRGSSKLRRLWPGVARA
jgi:hypothetical protein